jgi:hypothetical protein
MTYNILGHYLVLIYQQQVTTNYFSQSLADDNIPDDDLFIVKVPVSLYLPAKNTDFEPITGSFEYKGKFYDMVKRKVANDTLYIYCANNHQKQELATQLAAYVKSYVVDFENTKNGTNKNEQVQKSFAKDYLIVVTYRLFSFYNCANCEKCVIAVCSFPAVPLISIPSPPPEVA